MKEIKSPISSFDYIVVGGGLSGLYSAYYLSKSGTVALIALATLEDSNSYYAQGGMAAVTHSSDTPAEHYSDTMVAGAGLCDSEAVRVLTEEAPDRVEEMIQHGMKFDTVNGELARGLEGGHHHHRILHAGGDATGKKVTQFMIGEIKSEPNIQVFEQHTLIELIMRDGECYGVWVMNAETNQIEGFVSKYTILATGGAAALYQPTTNPPSALGDGLAVAYRAGAKVRDMEFIQFHPTALNKEGAPSFLISEAVRGEGAHLLNPDGERFMLNRHPLAELAPRDIVAREIYKEMDRYKVDEVTLSLKHLNPDFIKKRFPTISLELQKYGVDFTHEIPIAPAAHYTVGGLEVDLNGRTSIEGLFAVGELASTGVMGANRLASNSLIECTVFAKRIVEYVKLNDRPMISDDVVQSLVPTLQLDPTFSEEEWRSSIGDKLMRKLGKQLMKRAGIIRKEKKLLKGLQKIEKVLDRLEEDQNRSVQVRLIYNRYVVGSLIMLSALHREESRGGHYHSDFSERLPDDMSYHTIIQDNKLTHVKHHGE